MQKKKPDLHQFGSLPGVKGGRLKGPMVGSISGFMSALRKYRVCSDAGDHGSVMVYRDDDGRLRCYFMRWHSIVEEQNYKTKAEVRAWLKKWLPVQYQQQSA